MSEHGLYNQIFVFRGLTDGLNFQAGVVGNHGINDGVFRGAPRT